MHNVFNPPPPPKKTVAMDGGTNMNVHGPAELIFNAEKTTQTTATQELSIEQTSALWDGKSRGGKSPTVGVEMRFPGDSPNEGQLIPTPQEFSDPYSRKKYKIYRSQYRVPTKGFVGRAQQWTAKRDPQPHAAPKFNGIPFHPIQTHIYAPFAHFNVGFGGAAYPGGAIHINGGGAVLPAAQVMNMITQPGAPTMQFQGAQIAGAAPQAIGINHLPFDANQRLGTGGGEFKAFGTAMNVWSGDKASGPSVKAPKGFKSQGTEE
jgi:hypothetical protein